MSISMYAVGIIVVVVAVAAKVEVSSTNLFQYFWSYS